MKLVKILLSAALVSGLSVQAWAMEDLVEGTVKKIDAAQNKITIKHGELKKLEMGAMTMVFAAGDSVDVGKLKVGQKIKFSADRVNGRLTVTAVE